MDEAMATYRQARSSGRTPDCNRPAEIPSA